ncbi:hypothetical protein, partial [Xanthomonas hortorum]|uniref:hypothetical protein n=3 Tax=Xanthomonas hortorum TaxID=56454 RepID=UPI0019D3EA10
AGKDQSRGSVCMVQAVHVARLSDALVSDRLLSICNGTAIPDVTSLVNDNKTTSWIQVSGCSGGGMVRPASIRTR